MGRAGKIENLKPMERRSAMESHKPAKPFVWVKDKDGNTYLCPKEELVDPKNLSQSEIKNYCIDESTVPPWND
jgi:hypothetical protein